MCRPSSLTEFATQLSALSTGVTLGKSPNFPGLQGLQLVDAFCGPVTCKSWRYLFMTGKSQVLHPNILEAVTGAAGGQPHGRKSLGLCPEDGFPALAHL